MPEFKYDRSNPGPCCQKIDDMIQYARPIVERWPNFHKRSLGFVKAAFAAWQISYDAAMESVICYIGMCKHCKGHKS